jgi:hypothetical protein
VNNASQVQARFRRSKRSVLIRPTATTTKLLDAISRRMTENDLRKLAVYLTSMPERDLLVVKHCTHI